MQARYLLLGAVAVLATACIQDPESPMNLPDVPKLAVDETSVTRVSMVVNVTLGSTADVSEYGVEVSETLFDAGGSYKVLALQRGEGNEYSAGVSDLKSNTTYFLRAFISNGHSKMYSDILTQKTPETSVASVSDVTVKDNYYLVATIEDNGGRSVEDVGFMWGTSNERKSIKREKRYAATLDADGKTFTLPLSEVGEGTHYIMAYVEDDKDGTGYSRIPYEFVLKGEDEAQIEDPEFKKYLVMYHDYNEDSKISYAELKQIEFIDVHTDNIRSVREIEQMPLHSLMVSGRQQGSGQLTTLNVQKDTLLRSLDCSNNQLKELNVSMIPDLEFLNCQGNPMEVLYLSWYQHFNELLYPQSCRIVYVDKPDEPIQEGQPNNEIWYTTTDGNAVSIKSNKAFNATIVSNTYENGKGILKFSEDVTTMSDYAFLETGLQSISLPESLQTFEVGFYGCYELESIHLPSHLLTVPGHFIVSLNKLRELEFPETDDIAENWMNGPIALCPNLEKLTGPYATDDNKALIKDGKMFAFAGAGMKSYTIPEVVKILGEDLFRGYQLEHVQLPGKLEKISDSCFEDTPIMEVDIPESVKLIKNGAFRGCHSLRSVYIPSGADVESSVFDWCESLESFSGHYASEDGRCLIKQESSSYISLIAFAPAGLTSYSIPEGVTIIETAFNYGENGLVSLTIPQSVSRMLGISSPSIRTLTCLAETPPTLYASLTLADIEAIYVPAASVDAYKSAQYWSTYADKIQAISTTGNVTVSKYLTFTSEGSTSISLFNQNDNAPLLYYSYDLQNWTQWDYNVLTFTQGSPLYLCGDNPQGIGTSEEKYSNFRYVSLDDSPYTVSGDIMSLINKDEDVSVIPSDYCFYMLFMDNPGLTAAPSLPATTLTKSCYQLMFDHTGLMAAPALPATTLADYCYTRMFSRCASLTTAPELPATALAPHCYERMFFECNALESVQTLPATTLAEYCYAEMFMNSNGLTHAPELPAASLVEGCYSYMFSGCENLFYVICLATDISATACTENWLYYVASSGTFVKASNIQWPSGDSGIPEGWTVVNDGDVPNGGNEGTGEEEWN